MLADLRPVSDPLVPRPSVKECARRLGLDPKRVETLPLFGQDATAGTETELQVAVRGTAEDVDLPCTIRASRYLANVRQRVGTGEASKRHLQELEEYLEGSPDEVWENSWVRLAPHRLGRLARRVLEEDLRANRHEPRSPRRSDLQRFLCRQNEEAALRIPISYLLRLALADVLDDPTPESVRRRGFALLPHLMDDNTSPETSSFTPIRLQAETGNGRELARETSRRFLLTHLLASWANERFGLRESGQVATIFFSPHPPVRQKLLNAQISDAFYRHLFISPCLAWEDGEAKHRYMVLCHQVLSRSHLNALGKLREMGIIAHNLVVLPSVSNLSLANNGVHINIGSERLARRLQDRASGFGPAHEKCLGDLVVKVFEHFLPLFVGTLSAAPYRLGFSDFHPERALGSLAHELHESHLRMMWRRWKKKARNRVLGRPFTPFGPPWFDRTASWLFRLQGDHVPDFRLVDYPVALLATGESSALDGTLENSKRLAADLDALGVFDHRMSVYLPMKVRQLAAAGFSGFEGRHYSLFPSLAGDLAAATDLQHLLLGIAWQLVASGEVDHSVIPDDPESESERRQVFFCSALGVPTFYVRQDTQNRFLRRLLEKAPGVRRSRRYRGYFRVTLKGYRKALLAFLEEWAPPLVEHQGFGDVLPDLRRRLEDHKAGAAGRLERGILDQAGVRSPFELPADEFNQAAESWYRDTLRRQHLEEALDFLAEDVERLGLGEGKWLANRRQALLTDECPPQDLRRFLSLVLRAQLPHDAAEPHYLEEAS